MQLHRFALLAALLITAAGSGQAQHAATPGPATTQEQFTADECSPMSVVAPAPVPLSPLSAQQKFHYFTSNTFEPFTFLGAGLEAGLSQLDHDNLGFGQGGDGFGKRYGAAVADRVSFGFFALYALPAAFHQDPRYTRKSDGPFASRAAYAFSRTFVARSDAGGDAFNISKIGGAFLSAGLSNAYFPQQERTLGFTLRSAGLNVGTVLGYNLLREFGPDLRRKFLRKRSR